MGNESSTLSHGDVSGDDHRPRRASSADGEELEAAYCGFRVLGIQEQSPASRVGFVSFFDFILEANGIRLCSGANCSAYCVRVRMRVKDTKDSTLMELIAQSEDRPMQLTVYNVKSQTTRELELTPSREWPGKGLLGVTIRFDSYEGAEDQLLHVLNVARTSPADRAGLTPESDYLLGTPERVFRDPEDLHDEIVEALEDTFQCYVYNSELDQVRIVSISPSEKWGGEGVLGAEVAHGYLHRLPTSSRNSIGSSVGFVNLSKDAKAATDAFMKRSRPQTDEAGVDSTAENADAQVPGRDVAISGPTRDSSENQTQVETAEEGTGIAAAPEEAEPAPVHEDAAVVQEAAAQGELTIAAEGDKEEEATPKEAPSPAPTKPRYTARTDMRFPMSTVEVYVDPYQLS